MTYSAVNLACVIGVLKGSDTLNDKSRMLSEGCAPLIGMETLNGGMVISSSASGWGDSMTNVAFIDVDRVSSSTISVRSGDVDVLIGAGTPADNLVMTHLLSSNMMQASHLVKKYTHLYLI